MGRYSSHHRLGRPHRRNPPARCSCLFALPYTLLSGAKIAPIGHSICRRRPKCAGRNWCRDLEYNHPIPEKSGRAAYALRSLRPQSLIYLLYFLPFQKCTLMWTSDVHWNIIFEVIGMWHYDIADKLEPGRSYSRTDVIAILKQERGGYRDNSYIWTVGALVKDGILQHDGRNQYSLPGKRKKPYVPLYSVAAQTIQFQVANRFPLTGFTVFESILLKEFLNHLIARNTIFVQVNRPLGAFVFDFLREYTEKPVLYRPSSKDFNKYWKPDSIVVLDWTSEAPLNPSAPHDITIEKMLVDIFCDKSIRVVYSSAEYPTIVQDAYERYPVDTVRLLRYARRRHREKEIGAFLPKR